MNFLEYLTFQPEHLFASGELPRVTCLLYIVSFFCKVLFLFFILFFPLQHPANATSENQNVASDTLLLDIDDAVRLALERNRGLQITGIDLETAEVGVREVRSEVLPQISADAGFMRNIRAIAPFAGTPATDLFAPAVPDEWLAFNERARTDGDQETEPITLMEFQERREQAFRDAGISPEDPDVSPFTVPNQFDGGISISQTLYNPAMAANIRSARAMRDASEEGLKRQEIVTADSARQAFLGTQLVEERVEIISRSIERTENEFKEARRRVDEGIASVSERLAANVQLGNLKTDLIEAETQLKRAMNNFKLSVGINPAQPVRLTGALEVDDGYAMADVAIQEALDTARDQRYDLKEAHFFLASREASFDAARNTRLPRINAIANFNVAGNVPYNRDRIITDPLNPFDIEVEQRRIFSSNFWSLGLSAGLQISWSIFEGRRISAQNQQAFLDVRQAELQFEQLREVIHIEVEDAIHDLVAARNRALLQEENVIVAEQNYEAAHQRVLRGIATQVERREAASQLDQSRLNLLQAKHDYLSARSRLLTAIGVTQEQL